MTFRLSTLALALLACLGLAACDLQRADPGPPIAEGTVLVTKVSGNHYKSKAAHVEGGFVTWVYYWKKKPVAKFKSYRGLMNVFSEEEGFRRWIEFDTKLVDQLFPLEVGREATITGRQHLEKERLDFPFTATIEMRERDKVKIKDSTYPVFVIDLTFVEHREQGEVEMVKTLWYSPELELALKAEYLFEGRVYPARVISLTGPDGELEEEPYEPEGLGTIRV